MKNMSGLGVIFCSVLLAGTGCSNKQIYEGVQASNRHECMQRPQSQQADCFAQAGKSYDEYQREREELEREGRH